MDLTRIAALLCSVVFALIGFKAILTREIALSQDDDSTEPELWLYGWRAAAVGGLFVLVALLCLGVAAGIIPATWSGSL